MTYSGLISQIRVKIPYYYGLTWSVIFSCIVINLWWCLLNLNLRVSTLEVSMWEPSCISSLFCHMQWQCLSLENMLCLLKQFWAIKPPFLYFETQFSLDFWAVSPLSIARPYGLGKYGIWVIPWTYKFFLRF